MRKQILNLVTLSAMLFAVSCNKVNELPDEPTNVGKLLIPTTTIKGDYKAPNGEEATVPYDVKNFMVTISQYGEDGTTLTPVKDKKWKVGEMPGKVGLEVGSYAMQAVSYEGKQLEASDVPYFYGTQDFKIAYDAETPINLNIAVKDAKVSFEPSDAFKLAFTDWNMKVVTKADQTKQLFELNETTPNKFMKPTDVVLNVQATRRNSPVVWTDVITYDNVVAGDWLKVKVDITPIGNVTVSIVVDNTLTEREVIIEVPNDDEDLGGGGIVTPEPDPDPDPEEPEVPTFDKPAIVGLNGLNIDAVHVVSKSASEEVPVMIQIDADNGGIQKLNVLIESQETWFMPLINQLFEGNSFDLANLVDGSTTKTSLISLQIISDNTLIKNEKSFIFDITTFMGALGVNNPVTNSYDFTITVEDNVGDRLEKKFVVRVIE